MTTVRHPNRPFAKVTLSDEQAEVQRQRGLFTVERGVWLPIPVDHIKRPTVFLNRDLWRQDAQGRVFRPGTRFEAPASSLQRKVLDFLRDHVHADIPALYYQAVLGHDLHVGVGANLYARHFHAGWANPFNPDKVDAPIDASFKHDCDMGTDCPMRPYGFGFVEDLGWLSGNKVTKAFVNVLVGALADAAASGEAAEFNDFNEHEVGTGSGAEANTSTALGTSSGIALTAGTQVDSGGDPPIYTSVATITADATETWEEHGVFSTSVDTLLDRSLTGGQSVNSSDQVEYTYALTVNPEA